MLGWAEQFIYFLSKLQYGSVYLSVCPNNRAGP